MKHGGFYLSAMLAILLFLGGHTVFAEEVGVADENHLKEAIARGERIVLTEDISLSSPLEIPRDLEIRVRGEGHRIFRGDDFAPLKDSNALVMVEDGAIFLEEVTLDGDDRGRVIEARRGSIALDGVCVSRGSGGAVYAEDTKIHIVGGSFENNRIKDEGRGAALSLSGGELVVNGDGEATTLFSGNGGIYGKDEKGTLGGNIYLDQGARAEMRHIEANIVKGFYCGGFLYANEAFVDVEDSLFKFKEESSLFGHNGGAFYLNNSHGSISNSRFNTEKWTKVTNLGGFIAIGGDDDASRYQISGNNFYGRTKYEGKEIAYYGGAIGIEDGSRGEILIKDNELSHLGVMKNGGAVAIGRDMENETPVHVVFENNYIWETGTRRRHSEKGGAISAARGARVSLDGDRISATQASLGGAIYNGASMEITGDAHLVKCNAYKLGGGIYNDGNLDLDLVEVDGWITLKNNDFSRNEHPEKSEECGGANIYTTSDVTIASRTHFGGFNEKKDIRLIGGDSKLLLRDSLKEPIAVSISEAAGGEKYPEKGTRKVGYLIAEGADGYRPTQSDAHFLHYMTKIQKGDPFYGQSTAAYRDDDSTGVWDFILSPEGRVVLGQRVSIVRDANGGRFEDGSSREETLVVYSPDPPYAYFRDAKKIHPEREGYQFIGWYDASAKDIVRSMAAEKATEQDENLFEKCEDYFEDREKNIRGDFSKLLDPASLTIYGGWVPLKEIPFKAEYKDINGESLSFEAMPEVVVTLFPGEESLILGSNSKEGVFRGKNAVDDRRKPINYSVRSDDIEGFRTEIARDDDGGFILRYIKEPETVFLYFVVDEADRHKGRIEGEFRRRVIKGTEASSLTEPKVAAMSGYRFIGWNPAFEGKIDRDTVYRARFETVESPTGHGAVSLELSTPPVENEGLDLSYRGAYMRGYPDGTFRPDASMTRGEMASMLRRLVDAEALSLKTPFKDVGEDAWYAEDIALLVERKVVSGYPDGSFRPDEEITRAEFAQILANLKHLEEKKDTRFTDLAGNWAKEAIAAVEEKGWVRGYPDETFRPRGAVTRAEAVAIVNRMLDLKIKEDLKDEWSPWSDLSADHWAYGDILSATRTEKSF